MQDNSELLDSDRNLQHFELSALDELGAIEQDVRGHKAGCCGAVPSVLPHRGLGTGSRGPPWRDPAVRSGAVWSAAGVAVPAYDTLLGNDANDALAATLDMDCSLQHYVGTDS